MSVARPDKGTTCYFMKCLSCGNIESFWSARWKSDTTCKSCGASGKDNWRTADDSEVFGEEDGL